MTGDIILSSKPIVDNEFNIGSGNVDWVLDGCTIKVGYNLSEYILQALFKAMLTRLQDSGYGCDVPSFRGTKHIVPTRVGIGMRLLRNTSLLSTWYRTPLEILRLDIGVKPNTLDTFNIKLDIGVAKGEIAV